MNKIVAVEGINGAGKSHFISRFISIFDEYNSLYELSDKFEGGHTFPKFSIKEGEIKKQIGWFIEQEKERYRDAKKLLKTSLVLTDRCLISTIAFSYARQKKYNTREKDFLQDQLLGLEKKRFKFPWIVYIQPKNNFLQMIRDRENSPLFNKASSLTPPYDPFFYSLMLGYYNSLKDRLDERILFLDNDRDVEENCLKAEKWIQSRETPWPEINMWELFY